MTTMQVKGWNHETGEVIHEKRPVTLDAPEHGVQLYLQRPGLETDNAPSVVAQWKEGQWKVTVHQAHSLACVEIVLPDDGSAPIVNRIP